MYESYIDKKEVENSVLILTLFKNYYFENCSFFGGGRIEEEIEEMNPHITFSFNILFLHPVYI